MLDFALGLQGLFGSYPDNTQVKISGFSQNFIVKKSFPLLVSDNSYILVYLLQDTINPHLGIFAPQSLLTLADKDVELSGGAPFDETNLKLNGFFGLFKDGYFVRLKDGDKVFKVRSSFLMLSSSNTSIVCCELTDVNDNLRFFCPCSSLVRVFEPESIVQQSPGGGGSVSPGEGGFYG